MKTCWMASVLSQRKKIMFDVRKRRLHFRFYIALTNVCYIALTNVCYIALTNVSYIALTKFNVCYIALTNVCYIALTNVCYIALTNVCYIVLTNVYVFCIYSTSKLTPVRPNKSVCPDPYAMNIQFPCLYICGYNANFMYIQIYSY